MYEILWQYTIRENYVLALYTTGHSGSTHWTKDSVQGPRRYPE